MSERYLLLTNYAQIIEAMPIAVITLSGFNACCTGISPFIYSSINSLEGLTREGSTSYAVDVLMAKL